MIIGILGLAGSGKTTAANALAKRLNAPIVSVAAPIRAMLQAMGLGPADFIGKAKARPIVWLGSKSPRDLMQSLGDWGRRDVAMTLWASIAGERIDALQAPGKSRREHVLVDDIRLPVEAALIRQRGGLLIRVVRPGTQTGTHNTERAGQLIDVDAELINASTQADLERQALDWLSETLEDAA